MEEKWLIKELLLLQYHVAPQQSRPVRDIHQAGSSLPGVLGSLSAESRLHVRISIGAGSGVGINASHRLV